jgi:DNA-binding transcriptional LysR family regulator
MSITLTQLTAFAAVVRGGSVTAAADELIVTQPSVSAAIAGLERELGCELLTRAGRGIRLTAAGEAFAPYARDVLGLLRDAGREAREASGVAGRRLQIAAVTTAAESFVPALMRAFSVRAPEIELTLAVGNRHDVLEWVLGHTADVAVSGRPPGDDRLSAQPFLENAIVCIGAPDDPLARGRRPDPPELAGRVWLLREPGSGTRALNEQYLAERGWAPRTLTLGSNGAIKQAARAGLGVSLLSRAAVAAELSAGLLGEIRLRHGPPARPWFVLRSAVGPPRPTVERFCAFVRDWEPDADVRRTAQSA